MHIAVVTDNALVSVNTALSIVNIFLYTYHSRNKPS